MLLAVCISLGLLTGSPSQSPSSANDQPFFEDVTERIGLTFEHHAGGRGDLLFPEITGSGGALFDYDHDGDLDVYLVQSSVANPQVSLQGGQDRLYSNDAVAKGNPSDPVFRLVDVTEHAGLEALDYGMGVAIGDVDGDGFDAIYLTHYGPI